MAEVRRVPSVPEEKDMFRETTNLEEALAEAEKHEGYIVLQYGHSYFVTRG